MTARWSSRSAPQQRRAKVTAGFSNRGVDLLGGGQFDLRGELYGLGTDGDELTLAASSASDLKRFRTVSVSYAAPLTASGLTARGPALPISRRARWVIRGSALPARRGYRYPIR